MQKPFTMSAQVMDVPEMRAMYLRRLRSIMDEFLNGWVQQRFTDNYNIIAAAAKNDNAKWNGGPPALGYKCVCMYRSRAGSHQYACCLHVATI